MRTNVRQYARQTIPSSAILSGREIRSAHPLGYEYYAPTHTQGHRPSTKVSRVRTATHCGLIDAILSIVHGGIFVWFENISVRPTAESRINCLQAKILPNIPEDYLQFICAGRVWLTRLKLIPVPTASSNKCISSNVDNIRLELGCDI